MSAARINVLVTGYGNVGTPILKALTTSEFKDRIAAFVLIRPASLTDPTKQTAIEQVRALGVAIVEGDLESGVPALTTLLKAANIHTVVCVVGGNQILQQLPLVEAAKAAGVRHFIPSEFAFDTDAVPLDGSWGFYSKGKHAVQQAVVAAGLDYTRLFVGLFTEFAVPMPIMGVDLEHGMVAAPQSWEAKFNTTTIDETSWLVAAAVVEPQARNATMYCGEPVSYKQLADMLDAARGKPLQRRIRSVEEAQKALDSNEHDFPARLVSTVADGRGVWWPVEQTYTAKYHSERKRLSLADWIKSHVQPVKQ